MKRTHFALLLALMAAAAPLAAQEHQAENLPPALEHQEAATPDHGAAAEEGHGDFDAMHHVLDAQTLDFQPLGEIHLPPKGSWQVGPVDMTPTRHTVFLALAGLLAILIFVPAGLAARRRNAGDVPRGRANVAEGLALYFRDQVVMPNIGHGGEKFVPFLLTLFIFILLANLLGMLPWGAAATGNISVTAALAIISFITIEIAGMRALGSHYLGTIFYWNKELPLPMRVVMFAIMSPVELIGKLAKPFALAVRLMANMMAGHIVLLSLFGVALAFGSIWIALGPGLMALALTFLEIFVAFLQAYVFVVLTSVFIGLIRHAH